MKINILQEKEVNVKFIGCDIGLGENINGFEIFGDIKEDEEIPFIEKILCGVYEYRWRPIIDIDEGKILDWPSNLKMDVMCKTVDDNILYILDENKQPISWYDDRDKDIVEYYDGYVPEILDTDGDGYGDYIQLHIDENGYIKDFNKEDIFEIIKNEDY